MGALHDRLTSLVINDGQNFDQARREIAFYKKSNGAFDLNDHKDLGLLLAESVFHNKNPTAWLNFFSAQPFDFKLLRDGCESPLFQAVRYNLPLSYFQAALRADPEALFARHNGKLPLEWAFSLGNKTAALALLELGSDPNATGSDGYPLLLASFGKEGKSPADARCALLLLEYGADPAAKGPAGETCADLASKLEFEDFKTLLAELQGRGQIEAESRSLRKALREAYGFEPCLSQIRALAKLSASTLDETAARELHQTLEQSPQASFSDPRPSLAELKKAVPLGLRLAEFFGQSPAPAAKRANKMGAA